MFGRKSESGYVWYACYGSNINFDRFMIYIDRCKERGKNGNPPAKIETITIPYKMYFAKSAKTWGGCGKAFLDATPGSGEAYGRAYLITSDQFEEIKHMEGKDYQKLLTLPSFDRYPVYTFTDQQTNRSINLPSSSYYNTILTGLMDAYKGKVDRTTLARYLNRCVMSRNQYYVAREIFKAERTRGFASITLRDIAAILNIDVEAVQTAARWLEKHNVISQVADSRYITVEAESARSLIASMIAAYSSKG